MRFARNALRLALCSVQNKIFFRRFHCIVVGLPAISVYTIEHIIRGVTELKPKKKKKKPLQKSRMKFCVRVFFRLWEKKR